MKRGARPAPAYKTRLAERAARLQERREFEAQTEVIRLHCEFLRARMDAQLKAQREARAKSQQLTIPRNRITSFFERLINVAADTTRRLAQDFTPKKGIGDARFFA
ncbi:hypothetical protein [Azohydromonas lata]|uniref:hypothetical protein n=1 Tax=Azohydromonas lata TaxID=45677 RepID=UPI00083515CF|nr:hypothetical protein [Azohydromonas lata]